MAREFIENILKSEDITTSIRKNLTELICAIPEIEPMVGFEHNHPHHHLDVWEHTLYALSLSQNNLDIRLALLLHDIGKPHSYQDDEVRHFKGHPEMSANIAKSVLERLGYKEDYITYICEIIRRHDTPLTKEDIQSKNNLSKVIFEVQKCDALAHNPAKNKKRIEYIIRTTKLLKEVENMGENIPS